MGKKVKSILSDWILLLVDCVEPLSRHRRKMIRNYFAFSSAFLSTYKYDFTK